jgi:hypothetical protein
MKWICIAAGSEVLLAFAGGAFLLIYLGVILPAIWSRKSTRRTAAAAVLAQLLNALRRP